MPSEPPEDLRHISTELSFRDHYPRLLFTDHVPNYVLRNCFYLVQISDARVSAQNMKTRFVQTRIAFVLLFPVRLRSFGCSTVRFGVNRIFQIY